MNIFAPKDLKEELSGFDFASHVLWIGPEGIVEVVTTMECLNESDTDQVIKNSFDIFQEIVVGYCNNSDIYLGEIIMEREVEPGCNAAIFSIRFENGEKYQLNFVSIN